jgi:putative ABC transport system substrate-binding protein
MPLIGFLGGGSNGPFEPFVAALHKGLHESGYIEGQNVTIEFRWADNDYRRLPELAAELVSGQAAVIVAAGGPAARAAKKATSKIPIVFTMGVDPVASGLVASFNRPGANVTGISVLSRELSVKRLELLRELVPAAVIAVLVNPNNPNAELGTSEVDAAASVLKQRIIVLKASSEVEIDQAYATLREQDAGALSVMDDSFFTAARDHLITLAARHRVPAIYDRRQFAAAGGLMSYGPSITDAYRQTGVYAGMILKGAKAAELPVLNPTKFELVINLKTARALGLDIPDKLLALVDEAIE